MRAQNPTPVTVSFDEIEKIKANYKTLKILSMRAHVIVFFILLVIVQLFFKKIVGDGRMGMCFSVPLLVQRICVSKGYSSEDDWSRFYLTFVLCCLLFL
jgi:hypothetical protein